MTPGQKIRAARKAIQEFREIEDTFSYMRSRSTATRTRYKAAFEVLAEVEAILNGSPKDEHAAAK